MVWAINNGAWSHMTLHHAPGYLLFPELVLPHNLLVPLQAQGRHQGHSISQLLQGKMAEISIARGQRALGPQLSLWLNGPEGCWVQEEEISVSFVAPLC